MARTFDAEIVDPFAQITAPPVDETAEQRRIRERKEEEERRISNEIDEALKVEREEIRAKRRNRLKVLLLGQSESGESRSFARLMSSGRRRRIPTSHAARISNFSLSLGNFPRRSSVTPWCRIPVPVS